MLFSHSLSISLKRTLCKYFTLYILTKTCMILKKKMNLKILKMRQLRIKVQNNFNWGWKCKIILLWFLFFVSCDQYYNITKYVSPGTNKSRWLFLVIWEKYEICFFFSLPTVFSLFFIVKLLFFSFIGLTTLATAEFQTVHKYNIMDNIGIWNRYTSTSFVTKYILTYTFFFP